VQLFEITKMLIAVLKINFIVLFIIFFYIYILTLEMASAGKRHCASCIGTLLFPIGFEDERRFLGDGGCVTRGSVTSAERVHTFCRRRRRRGRSNRRVWLSNHISITAHTGGTSRQFGRGIKQVSLALCCEIYTSLFA